MLHVRCLLAALLLESIAGLHAGAGFATKLPQLVRSAPARTSRLLCEETFPTLEEELASGAISQEEYDALAGVVDESELELDKPVELSQEAQKIMKGMTSEAGVEFAPWMKVDAEAIAKAKAEREARKARMQAANAGKQDVMLIDPQAAELGAGGGLKSKVLSEDEVELKWDTQDESGNAGFIVQRRPGGSESWVDLDSYETYSPLRTKGPAGGTYLYLDDTAGVGTWVYRILDCDTRGTRSAVCQKLVEVDSAAEGKQTLIVGGAIASLAVLFFLAGSILDPIQTTSKGSALF